MYHIVFNLVVGIALFALFAQAGLVSVGLPWMSNQAVSSDQPTAADPQSAPARAVSEPAARRNGEDYSPAGVAKGERVVPKEPLPNVPSDAPALMTRTTPHDPNFDSALVDIPVTENVADASGATSKRQSATWEPDVSNYMAAAELTGAAAVSGSVPPTVARFLPAALMSASERQGQLEALIIDLETFMVDQLQR